VEERGAAPGRGAGPVPHRPARTPGRLGTRQVGAASHLVSQSPVVRQAKRGWEARLVCAAPSQWVDRVVPSWDRWLHPHKVSECEGTYINQSYMNQMVYIKSADSVLWCVLAVQRRAGVW
jgi:hypothetical protein